jgi:hypothetical protein
MLNSTANGQLQNQHECKQQYDSTGQNKQETTTKKQRKINQTRVTRNICKFAVETQRLEEQVNLLKLRMFRVGTRRPSTSRTGGQHLEPLKTFSKNEASV